VHKIQVVLNRTMTMGPGGYAPRYSAMVTLNDAMTLFTNSGRYSQDSAGEKYIFQEAISFAHRLAETLGQKKNSIRIKRS